MARERVFDVDVFEDRIWSENEKMMSAPDDTASDGVSSIAPMHLCRDNANDGAQERRRRAESS